MPLEGLNISLGTPKWTSPLENTSQLFQLMMATERAAGGGGGGGGGGPATPKGDWYFNPNTGQYEFVQGNSKEVTGKNWEAIQQYKARKAAEDPTVKAKQAEFNSHSVEWRTKHLPELRKTFIPETAARLGVDGGLLLRTVMGPVEEKLSEDRTAVQGAGMGGVFGHAFTERGVDLAEALSNFADNGDQALVSAKARKERHERNAEENAWVLNDLRREQEGESAFDRFSLNTVARATGGMLGSLGAPAAISAAGNLVVPGSSIVTAPALFAAAGAAESRQALADRLLADPTLTDEERIRAYNEGSLKAGVIGGGIGAMTRGLVGPTLRTAGEQAALRGIGRGVGAQAVRDATAAGTYEGMTAAARTNLVRNAVNNRIATQSLPRRILGAVPETMADMAVFGAGQTIGQNYVYNAATGQSNPLTQGVGNAIEEGILGGAVLAPFNLRRPRPLRPVPAEAAAEAAASEGAAGATPRGLGPGWPPESGTAPAGGLGASEGKARSWRDANLSWTPEDLAATVRTLADDAIRDRIDTIEALKKNAEEWNKLNEQQQLFTNNLHDALRDERDARAAGKRSQQTIYTPRWAQLLTNEELQSQFDGLQAIRNDKARWDALGDAGRQNIVDAFNFVSMEINRRRSAGNWDQAPAGGQTQTEGGTQTESEVQGTSQIPKDHPYPTEPLDIDVDKLDPMPFRQRAVLYDYAKHYGRPVSAAVPTQADFGKAIFGGVRERINKIYSDIANILAKVKASKDGSGGRFTVDDIARLDALLRSARAVEADLQNLEKIEQKYKHSGKAFHDEWVQQKAETDHYENAIRNAKKYAGPEAGQAKTGSAEAGQAKTDQNDVQSYSLDVLLDRAHNMDTDAIDEELSKVVQAFNSPSFAQLTDVQRSFLKDWGDALQKEQARRRQQMSGMKREAPTPKEKIREGSPEWAMRLSDDDLVREMDAATATMRDFDTWSKMSPEQQAALRERYDSVYEELAARTGSNESAPASARRTGPTMSDAAEAQRRQDAARQAKLDEAKRRADEARAQLAFMVDSATDAAVRGASLRPRAIGASSAVPDLREVARVATPARGLPPRLAEAAMEVHRKKPGPVEKGKEVAASSPHVNFEFGKRNHPVPDGFVKAADARLSRMKDADIRLLVSRIDEALSGKNATSDFSRQQRDMLSALRDRAVDHLSFRDAHRLSASSSRVALPLGDEWASLTPVQRRNRLKSELKKEVMDTWRDAGVYMPNWRVGGHPPSSPYGETSDRAARMAGTGPRALGEGQHRPSNRKPLAEDVIAAQNAEYNDLMRTYNRIYPGLLNRTNPDLLPAVGGQDVTEGRQNGTVDTGRPDVTGEAPVLERPDREGAAGADNAGVSAPVGEQGASEGDSGLPSAPVSDEAPVRRENAQERRDDGSAPHGPGTPEEAEGTAPAPTSESGEEGNGERGAVATATEHAEGGEGERVAESEGGSGQNGSGDVSDAGGGERPTSVGGAVVAPSTVASPTPLSPTGMAPVPTDPAAVAANQAAWAEIARNVAPDGDGAYVRWYRNEPMAVGKVYYKDSNGSYTGAPVAPAGLYPMLVNTDDATLRGTFGIDADGTTSHEDAAALVANNVLGANLVVHGYFDLSPIQTSGTDWIFDPSNMSADFYQYTDTNLRPFTVDEDAVIQQRMNEWAQQHPDAVIDESDKGVANFQSLLGHVRNGIEELHSSQPTPVTTTYAAKPAESATPSEAPKPAEAPTVPDAATEGSLVDAILSGQTQTAPAVATSSYDVDSFKRDVAPRMEGDSDAAKTAVFAGEPTIAARPNGSVPRIFAPKTPAGEGGKALASFDTVAQLRDFLKNDVKVGALKRVAEINVGAETDAADYVFRRVLHGILAERGYFDIPTDSPIFGRYAELLAKGSTKRVRLVENRYKRTLAEFTPEEDAALRAYIADWVADSDYLPTIPVPEKGAIASKVFDGFVDGAAKAIEDAGKGRTAASMAPQTPTATASAGDLPVTKPVSSVDVQPGADRPNRTKPRDTTLPTPEGGATDVIAEHHDVSTLGNELYNEYKQSPQNFRKRYKISARDNDDLPDRAKNLILVGVLTERGYLRPGEYDMQKKVADMGKKALARYENGDVGRTLRELTPEEDAVLRGYIQELTDKPIVGLQKNGPWGWASPYGMRPEVMGTIGEILGMADAEETIPGGIRVRSVSDEDRARWRASVAPATGGPKTPSETESDPVTVQTPKDPVVAEAVKEHPSDDETDRKAVESAQKLDAMEEAETAKTPTDKSVTDASSGTDVAVAESPNGVYADPAYQRLSFIDLTHFISMKNADDATVPGSLRKNYVMNKPRGEGGLNIRAGADWGHNDALRKIVLGALYDRGYLDEVLAKAAPDVREKMMEEVRSAEKVLRALEYHYDVTPADFTVDEIGRLPALTDPFWGNWFLGKDRAANSAKAHEFHQTMRRALVSSIVDSARPDQLQTMTKTVSTKEGKKGVTVWDGNSQGVFGAVRAALAQTAVSTNYKASLYRQFIQRFGGDNFEEMVDNACGQILAVSMHDQNISKLPEGQRGALVKNLQSTSELFAKHAGGTPFPFAREIEFDSNDKAVINGMLASGATNASEIARALRTESKNAVERMSDPAKATQEGC